MAGQPCWFVTIVHGRSVDAGLRAHIWHPLRTLLLHTFPDAAACTSIEWGVLRGVHLHAIITGAPALTCEWVERAVARIQPGARHFEPVGSQSNMAGYHD